MHYTSDCAYRKHLSNNIVGVNIYSKEIVSKFYKAISFTKFKTLTKERMAEIAALASEWRERKLKICKSTPELMTHMANVLITSRQNFNLTDDELVYFYIQIVDPKYKFLELSQLAQDKKELVSLQMKHFGIYDNVIVYLEQHLDKRLQEIEQMEIEKR